MKLPSTNDLVSFLVSFFANDSRSISHYPNEISNVRSTAQTSLVHSLISAFLLSLLPRTEKLLRSDLCCMLRSP